MLLLPEAIQDWLTERQSRVYYAYRSLYAGGPFHMS